MRPRSTIVTIALTAGLAFSLPGTASAADVDCADFPSRAAAQAALEADRTDPDDLDTDDDGTACETYDYAGRTASQITAVPAGGVAAGDGSSADSGPGALPLVLGGLTLAAAAGATAAHRSARRAV